MSGQANCFVFRSRRKSQRAIKEKSDFDRCSRDLEVNFLIFFHSQRKNRRTINPPSGWAARTNSRESSRRLHDGAVLFRSLLETPSSWTRPQKSHRQILDIHFRFRGRAYFTEKLSYSAVHFADRRSLVVVLLRFLLSFISAALKLVSPTEWIIVELEP